MPGGRSVTVKFQPERIFISQPGNDDYKDWILEPALFCESWFQTDDRGMVGPLYFWIGDVTDHDPGDEDPSDGIALRRRVLASAGGAFPEDL